jgi:hypothetical protein
MIRPQSTSAGASPSEKGVPHALPRPAGEGTQDARREVGGGGEVAGVSPWSMKRRTSHALAIRSTCTLLRPPLGLPAGLRSRLPLLLDAHVDRAKEGGHLPHERARITFGGKGSIESELSVHGRHLFVGAIDD